jgi:hypothetical protein
MLELPASMATPFTPMTWQINVEDMKMEGGAEEMDVTIFV